MEKQLTVRMSAEEERRFEAARTHCGIDRGPLVRALVGAFCDAVEREGEIRVPLAVISAAGKAPLYCVPEREARGRERLFLEAGLLAAGLVGFVGLRLAGRRKAASCAILATRSIAAVASIIHSFMLRRGMSTDVAGEPRMVAGESPAPRSIPRMKQSGSPVNSQERGPA